MDGRTRRLPVKPAGETPQPDYEPPEVDEEPGDTPEQRAHHSFVAIAAEAAASAHWVIETKCLDKLTIDKALRAAARDVLSSWKLVADKIEGQTIASGPRGVQDANFEDDTFAPDENVEESQQVRVNVLDTITHAKVVAEACRKILKVSPFDREAKKEVSDAVELLIRKWRFVQTTLDAKARS